MRKGINVVNNIRNRLKLISSRICVDANDCWNWTGTYIATSGRPTILFGRKRYLVYRLMCQWFIGPINPQTDVHHKCKNIECINPTHLEPLDKSSHTATKNLYNSNQFKTHCKRGHKFTEENTYKQPRGRLCLTCKKLYDKERYLRRKKV